MFLQGPYFSAEGALGLPKAKSWWEHWKCYELDFFKIHFLYVDAISNTTSSNKDSPTNCMYIKQITVIKIHVQPDLASGSLFWSVSYIHVYVYCSPFVLSRRIQPQPSNRAMMPYWLYISAATDYLPRHFHHAIFLAQCKKSLVLFACFPIGYLFCINWKQSAWSLESPHPPLGPNFVIKALSPVWMFTDAG